MQNYKRILGGLMCFALMLFVTACGNPGANLPKATVNPDQKEAAPAVPAPAATPAGPTAETPPTPVPAPVAEAPQTFKLSPYSSIIFLGSNLIGTREGGFSKFDGSVTMQGSNIETMQLDVDINMTSVYSDSTILTEKLKGDKGFFEVDQFPNSTFKSTAVTKNDQGYTVSGDLDLHGIKKNLSFPAKITVDDKGLKAEAEFVINRQDFKIVYEGTGDYAVRDDVVVKLDIQADKVAS